MSASGVIHCFGNSHTSLFTGGPHIHSKAVFENHTADERKEFRTYPMGPIICYNFTQKHLPKLLEHVSLVKPGDRIMLVVGEVDCRWHIPKQAQAQGISVEAAVDVVVNRYFQSFLALKAAGFATIAWGAHPSTSGGHDDTPAHPVFGDMALRNRITRHFNRRLRRLCVRNDIPFVCIYDRLVDETGATNMRYFRDYCHLSPACMPFVEEAFQRAGIFPQPPKALAQAGEPQRTNRVE